MISEISLTLTVKPQIKEILENLNRNYKLPTNTIKKQIIRATALKRYQRKVLAVKDRISQREGSLKSLIVAFAIQKVSKKLHQNWQ